MNTNDACAIVHQINKNPFQTYNHCVTVTKQFLKHDGSDIQGRSLDITQPLGSFGHLWKLRMITGKFITAICVCCSILIMVNSNTTEVPIILTAWPLSNHWAFPRLIMELLPMFCYPQHAYIILSATSITPYMSMHYDLLSSKILKTGNTRHPTPVY